MTDTLLCPNCGLEIEVSTVLASQVRQHLRREFEAEARKKERELALRQQEMEQREKSLAESRETLDREIQQRLVQERSELLMLAEAQVRESVASEMAELKEQLAGSQSKLQDAQAAEVELRKERRELESQTRELELAVNRRLDEERRTLREEGKREALEEHQLRDADRDKLINDLRKQIDDLKRKSEQGSQQAQGEVMELELEDILRQQFALDVIEPVPVGAHGGDLLQHVYDGSGQECGTILWESKRTKSWSDGWLAKLRDDQRTAKAEVAVLTSVELPKGFSSFGLVDGVWITSRTCLVGLAGALRAGLLEVARTRRAMIGQQTKSEFLYNYFSGTEFRQRVEGIVEAFVALKTDLDKEKRSMHRAWARREKQLERAVLHTAGLYGDVGGILGNKLAEISNLELPAVADLSDCEELENAPWA
jgi:hypothetical protein